MKPRQVLLTLAPFIVLVIVPTLLVALTGSADIGWSLPPPLGWFPVVGLHVPRWIPRLKPWDGTETSR